ncbi:hypothetical protein HJB82_10300 [Rhizobium sp. NZLR10]|uniref:hypothetical protein n=1 Tax=Rhizobium sp. NZLR10 TaxID=2731097 RepID=UPI001C840561|nr:hypothetical protein [Rhizobium sp. NZLR10]MBX5195714.1 hypothetical protein [Rhizobium sp. NZLR10]
MEGKALEPRDGSKSELAYVSVRRLIANIDDQTSAFTEIVESHYLRPELENARLAFIDAMVRFGQHPPPSTTFTRQDTNFPLFLTKEIAPQRTEEIV